MSTSLEVRRSVLRDAPGFTGPTLRDSGALGIYIAGKGLVCSMTPGALRDFARVALRLADALEAAGEAAPAMGGSNARH